MRIGMVSPYSFHVPGGVQFHIRDVAEHLLGQGHHVSVLAPSDDETPLPSYIASAGRAVPLPYNGSVARISFGPVASARVKRWLAENDFDVLHVHEPSSPSLSMLAMWAATGPIVATFHTSNPRSRAMQAAYPLLRPGFEKLSARIAVSEDARRTVVDHVGGDAVVIPNGVFVDRFATAQPRPEWQGSEKRPTLLFSDAWTNPVRGCRSSLLPCRPSLVLIQERVCSFWGAGRRKRRCRCSPISRRPGNRSSSSALSTTRPRRRCCARSMRTSPRTSGARVSASCS